MNWKRSHLLSVAVHISDAGRGSGDCASLGCPLAGGCTLSPWQLSAGRAQQLVGGCWQRDLSQAAPTQWLLHFSRAAPLRQETSGLKY